MIRNNEEIPWKQKHSAYISNLWKTKQLANDSLVKPIKAIAKLCGETIHDLLLTCLFSNELVSSNHHLSFPFLCPKTCICRSLSEVRVGAILSHLSLLQIKTFLFFGINRGQWISGFCHTCLVHFLVCSFFTLSLFSKFCSQPTPSSKLNTSNHKFVTGTYMIYMYNFL